MAGEVKQKRPHKAYSDESPQPHRKCGRITRIRASPSAATCWNNVPHGTIATALGWSTGLGVTPIRSAAALRTLAMTLTCQSGTFSIVPRGTLTPFSRQPSPSFPAQPRPPQNTSKHLQFPYLIPKTSAHSHSPGPTPQPSPLPKHRPNRRFQHETPLLSRTLSSPTKTSSNTPQKTTTVSTAVFSYIGSTTEPIWSPGWQKSRPDVLSI
jgi:hypothetical protein